MTDETKEIEIFAPELFQNMTTREMLKALEDNSDDGKALMAFALMQLSMKESEAQKALTTIFGEDRAKEIIMSTWS